MGSVKVQMNTPIDVSENMMKYFLKNLNYVVSKLNNRKKPLN